MKDIKNFLSNKAPSNNCQTQNDDYSVLIDGIRACSIANNLSSILIDFDKSEVLFISENLIYVDEATLNDFKRPSINPYWSLIDEITLDILSTVNEDYSKLKRMMTEEEYRRHLCIMDFPIIIRGKQFYIDSRFTPVRMRPDGAIKLGLFTFSPSSKRDMTFLVITTTGNRWSYDFHNRVFQEQNLGIRLSIAEKAVLLRAKKGMSNEEIANDLFLSQNTIKSHKMHIFKKLGVSSIAEALVVVGNYQLL